MSEETRLQTFERWLSDGDTFIGIFQNHALDSARCGHKIAMPFSMEQWDGAVIGKTRAPDHKSIGLGWKYLLMWKSTDAEDALSCMEEQDG